MKYETALIAVAAILSWGAFAEAADRPQRITKDLLVLYTFERPAGDVIRDRSGVGEPLDLK